MGNRPQDADRAAELARIDTSVPHPARVWDYWLGGKDNYAPDREVGDEIVKVMPDLPVNARAEREFIGRVVRHLAGERGLDQFLDVGTGIPTATNTHGVAQEVNPAARIVYVDNDPIVLVHARALLVGTDEGETDYIDADLRDPKTILREAARTLDFSRPIALMLMGVLEFVPDAGEAHAAVGTLLDALPPGSHLAIAHSLKCPPMDEAAARWNASGATPLTLRTEAELLAFFDGMELVEPGLVSLPKWRPEPGTSFTDREVFQYGVVGRKP
ncbi:SAM-dependent methyltransferase [Nonomuraea sp. MG754425]|uniref:SAM-dependent methyltransferase n=1 Tax=Nonomuraea sp. MG754425 TaxID=2570319 RepID=UPI001F2FA71B|nr:SAM-dependent methyltransferase [Nonomuraea sp. MG754425]MCF6471316.1 SAM-dependent methyltransferase [Nonomuraea sp. MG754425]